MGKKNGSLHKYILIRGSSIFSFSCSQAKLPLLYNWLKREKLIPSNITYNWGGSNNSFSTASFSDVCCSTRNMFSLGELTNHWICKIHMGEDMSPIDPMTDFLKSYMKKKDRRRTNSNSLSLVPIAILILSPGYNMS